jgi:hypothetical protein
MITKTNIVFEGVSPEASEIATHLFACWHDSKGVTSDESRVNFFHGWEGSRHLTREEILRHIAGRLRGVGSHEYQSQTWDGGVVEGTSHAYTSMPAPGQGYDVAKLALEMYFTHKYDVERVRLAGQVLGLGCYTRDAALSGEWAAIALLRTLSFDVARAYLNDPLKLFTGMDLEATAAQFSDLREIAEVKKVS